MLRRQQSVTNSNIQGRRGRRRVIWCERTRAFFHLPVKETRALSSPDKRTKEGQSGLEARSIVGSTPRVRQARPSWEKRKDADGEQVLVGFNVPPLSPRLKPSRSFPSLPSPVERHRRPDPRFVASYHVQRPRRSHGLLRGSGPRPGAESTTRNNTSSAAAALESCSSSGPPRRASCPLHTGISISVSPSAAAPARNVPKRSPLCLRTYAEASYHVLQDERQKRPCPDHPGLLLSPRRRRLRPHDGRGASCQGPLSRLRELPQAGPRVRLREATAPSAGLVQDARGLSCKNGPLRPRLGVSEAQKREKRKEEEGDGDGLASCEKARVCDGPSVASSGTVIEHQTRGWPGRRMRKTHQAKAISTSTDFEYGFGSLSWSVVLPLPET